jgi:hypothetical protein
LLIRNREYIEFETLKKQFWSYVRNIKTAINYFFYKRFAQNLPKFLLRKNLAEHWDLPTGIFYSKDVATGINLGLCTMYSTFYRSAELHHVDATPRTAWAQRRSIVKK